MPVCKQAEGL